MAKTSAGPAWGCVEGVVVGLWGAPGGKIPRARLYPNSTTPKGGALAPLVVSSDLAHLRVWEVGWGNAPLCFAVFWCGSPELLRWPGLAGGFPLVCHPLVGPL